MELARQGRVKSDIRKIEFCKNPKSTEPGMEQEFYYNFLRSSKIRYTRLLRVAMRYAQLQAYMAWYSTLGGAHSSLGDRFGVHMS